MDVYKPRLIPGIKSDWTEKKGSLGGVNERKKMRQIEKWTIRTLMYHTQPDYLKAISRRSSVRACYYNKTNPRAESMIKRGLTMSKSPWKKINIFFLFLTVVLLIGLFVTCKKPVKFVCEFPYVWCLINTLIWLKFCSIGLWTRFMCTYLKNVGTVTLSVLRVAIFYLCNRLKYVLLIDK